MMEVLFVDERATTTTRIRLDPEKWKPRPFRDVVRAFEKRKGNSKGDRYFKGERLLNLEEPVGDVCDERRPTTVRVATRPTDRREKDGKVRVALVCQLKDASERIESFVRYHLAIGFDRMYLYFDDCGEIEDVEKARSVGGDRVVVVVRDRKLKDEWSRLDGWDTLRHFCDRDVQVRQMLNALHALERARNRDDIDWLLHIDSDELFYPGDDDDDIEEEQPQRQRGRSLVERHFRKLRDDKSCSIFTYYNYEAVPETDDDRGRRRLDPFKTVTLFKRPMVLVPSGNRDAEEAVEFWRKRAPNNELFLFYQNGKSAVRCSLLDARPTSVHLWSSSSSRRAENDNARLHQTNDPRNNGIHCDHSVKCAILHYACTSHLALWRKYATLGNFPNECVANTVVHEPNTFHCLCRDEYVKHTLSPQRPRDAGDDERHHYDDLSSSSRAAMRDLFLNRVALIDSALISSRHIRAGVLQRIRLPESLLLVKDT